MALLADRFLLTGDGDEDIVDLATGEVVRIAIEPAASRAWTQARAAACDALSGLRHPLLLPLVDYGVSGGRWFEAHACLPALQAPGMQARRAALHLVRFLHVARVELTADAAARNVRPAIDAGPAGWRPIGVFLQWHPALDLVRALIESPGPPGVTAITIHAPPGAGLRTARWQMARAARQSGYLVMDSRFGALSDALDPPRHLCIFDWLTPAPVLPAALTLAAATGARRHLWIRFSRQAVGGRAAVGLEPMMTRDMTSMIYLDPDLGPSLADVRTAVAAANGRPGALIDTLTTGRARTSATLWVHEVSPEYLVKPPAPSPSRLAAPGETAGVARLERAVAAARALAGRGRHARAIRVLGRCAASLAARDARQAAASAALALGEIYLERARPVEAEAAFERARQWAPAGDSCAPALAGIGHALLEEGRLLEAEAALRTAILAAATEDAAADASRLLARTLYLRGRLDAAEDALGAGAGESMAPCLYRQTTGAREERSRQPRPGNPQALALLATIRLQKGEIAGAAGAAAAAVRAASDSNAVALCEAHLASVHVQTALGHVEAVRQHADAARAAARSARQTVLRVRVAAETSACLARCGVAWSAGTKDRLRRTCRRLPPLAAAHVRAALAGADTDPDVRRFMGTSGAAILMPSVGGESDLIQRFQSLLDALHDAPDESAALSIIATDIRQALDACSIVIRSARLGRQVAAVGRPWPAEEAVTRPVIDGACGLFQAGVTPVAAEPVQAAGATLGSIAARWVTGASPAPSRARDVLRVAAAAAAPVLKALTLPPAMEERPGQYPDDLLGRGPSADRMREAIRRAAQAPYPVLIEGESGSGKELVARAVHARSARRGRRFCAVNCAALTDDLLEAELFGHARGAFTGAVTERAGLFEDADQGTIFLDEAAELSGRAQAKLLRVLQEGEVRRVGETVPRKVDVRVVAASNRSLEQDVQCGRFRADLRFRLDVIRIAIPPLRERPDEVPWLVERIWAEASARVGTRATLGPDLIASLTRYDWPGNVRELQNVMASLAVQAPRRGRLAASTLPAHIEGQALRSAAGFDEARIEFERRYVRAALARAGGRRSAAAADLGVSRQGLAKIIKRLGIVES